MRMGRMMGAFLLLSALCLQVFAQSWPLHRGNLERTGVTSNSRTGTVNMLLGWTYPELPQLTAPIVVDNDTTRFSRTGSWFVPTLEDEVKNYFSDENSSTIHYRYTDVIFADDDSNPPRPTATATWLSHEPNSGKIGFYQIYVWVPSSGTFVGGEATSNVQRAVYEITDSSGRIYQVTFDQTRGGGWLPLGTDAYYHDGITPLRVRLTNVISSSGPDQGRKVVLVADGMRFVPAYGMMQASPVAIRSPLTAGNALVYAANGNGTVTAIEHQTGTTTMRVRWNYRVPVVPADQTGAITDNTSADFNVDDTLAWELRTDTTDKYGTDYWRILATQNVGIANRAVWRVRVTETGDYFVYAWFPSGDDHATRATYNIPYSGNQSLSATVDQRFGGRWVLLTAQPVEFRAGTTYPVELTNYSPSDIGRFVAADAIRVVSATTGETGVFSTPHVGQARVNDGGVANRNVIVFGADNGRVYCLDALGDGQNGTTQGSTKAYWIYQPPGNPGGFSYSSPIILNSVGGRDLVVIANPNGHLYAIDSARAHDQNDTDAIAWDFSISGSFVSSPAYDSSSQTLYIGSVEGGTAFGRIYAINAATGELRWAYPERTLAPIEPITATPALFNGRIYIGTGATSGRVYAISASTGQLAWRYPDPSDTRIAPTMSPFQYTSPTVVSGVDYNQNGNPINVLYLGNYNGRIYYFNADTGALLQDPGTPEPVNAVSENLGAAIFSSPVFTNIVDTDGDGTVFATYPAIVVATNAGNLYAVHATNRRNLFDGKAFEGWNLYGDRIFSSPAVLDDWLYVGDDAGILYAFNTRGSTAREIQEQYPELEQEIETADPERIPSNYDRAKTIITDDEQVFRDIQNGNVVPDPSLDRRTQLRALEYGQRFFVILWDIEIGDPNSPMKVIVTGPGNVREERDVTPRTMTNLPQGARPGMVFTEFTVQSRGSNFWTPGGPPLESDDRGYQLRIRVPNGMETADLDLSTPEIDGWTFGVANPLAIRGVGAVGLSGSSSNTINGNGAQLVSVTMPNVPARHDATIEGLFEVQDRRLNGSTIDPVIVNRQRLDIRIYASDIRWQGGATSVYETLPWERLPIFIPNNSLDYPDIPARQMSMLFRRATDLQRASGQPATTFEPVEVQVSIPRYQPANMTGYRTDPMQVYVDSDGNGRYTGLDSLLSPGSNQQRQEAYRTIDLSLRVEPDYRLVVEEQTIDFGTLPAGFGYNFNAVWANANNSAFRPDNLLFRDFWRPFRVKNLGNVNLKRMYVGKAFNALNFPNTLYSESISPEARMSMWITIGSNLDARFFPLTVPYTDPNTGINLTWSQPYAIIQKPRPSDYAPTYMSLPAVPYGQQAVNRPETPKISLAIPPFQPLGTYTNWVYVYSAATENQVPGVLISGNAYTSPTMRVVARVRETRMTGGSNTGSQVQVDPNRSAIDTAPTNTTPAAFRDANGNMHIYWSSNRAGSPNTMFLYKSTQRWDTNLLVNNFTPTNGWSPTGTSSAWWVAPFGPYPNDANGTIFEQLIGRQLTNEERGTIRHLNPSVFYNPGDGAHYLFWTGTVQASNTTRSLLLYVRLDATTGLPSGQILAVPLDMSVPKGRAVMVSPPGNRSWLIYTASTSGKENIFYTSVLQNNMTGGWGRERTLTTSAALRTINEVSAVPRRGMIDEYNRVVNRAVDLIVTGTVGDRTQAEAFLSRHSIERGDQLGNPMLFPMVVDEVAQKEQAANVWRVRHLDWGNLDNRFNQWRGNGQTIDLNIKVNGRSIIIDPDDTANPRRLQEPEVDDSTGLLTFRYYVPQVDGRGNVTGYLPNGLIVVDPLQGTIRFPNQAPRLSDVVTVIYRPRLLRLNELGNAGTHSQVLAFMQTNDNPRHNRADVASSRVRKNVGNEILEVNHTMGVDRLYVFYRRTTGAPSSPGTFYYRTYRYGVQLSSPIATTQGGRLPLQRSSNVSPGTNHAVVLSPSHALEGSASNIGGYEFDWARGRVYFTQADEGKTVTVRYIPAGSITPVEERLTIRMIDEGSLAGNRTQFETQVPFDLPTNELYLWAMPNSYQVPYTASPPLNQFAAQNEAVFLFWSSTRNGTPDIYAAAMQPRFYVDIPD